VTIACGDGETFRIRRKYADWIQDWIVSSAVHAGYYEDMTGEEKAEAAEREWEIR
jgi:hypothetical protein